MTRSHADAFDSSRSTRTLLLATDNKNSVLAEIAGGKPNSVAYSAYGQQSAQQDVATSLGFNGALREKHIGWYLLGNGYRAYNPTLMRFHSPDSWSPFGGGGLNAYMYCVGDPVNFSDPTGHMPKGLFSRLRMSGSKAGTTSEPQLTALMTNQRTTKPNQYQLTQSPSSSSGTSIDANTTTMPPSSTHVLVTPGAPRSPVPDLDTRPLQTATGQHNGQALSSSPPPNGMMTFHEWGELNRPQVRGALVNQQSQVVYTPDPTGRGRPTSTSTPPPPRSTPPNTRGSGRTFPDGSVWQNGSHIDNYRPPTIAQFAEQQLEAAFIRRQSGQ